MNRMQIILGALAGVLVVVLFWLLLWSPQQEELDAVRADIEQTQQRQQQLATERDALKAVRDQAPEAEAELAAIAAVLPEDPALPSALRQLQTAADESGTSLPSISPTRPAQVDGAPEGVSSIALSATVTGSYFQIVDFLRRIEEPDISPRGLIWNTITVNRTEYPELTVSLSGEMYTWLPATPEQPEEAPEDEPEDDDADADVDLEVEEEAE